MKSEDFERELHKIKCGFCGRAIIVEIVLMGISHNLGVAAYCKDCLRKNKVAKNLKQNIKNKT